MENFKKNKKCGDFRINVLLTSLKEKKNVLFAYPKFCDKYVPQYWSKFTPHDFPDPILVTGTIPIKWLQNPVDLVTFTEEILNGQDHFLCSVKPTSSI